MSTKKTHKIDEDIKTVERFISIVKSKELITSIGRNGNPGGVEDDAEASIRLGEKILQKLEEIKSVIDVLTSDKK